MKRYISIFLTFVLVLGAFVSPVAAAETDLDAWFPVLDYATPNNSGSYYVSFNGSSSINFNVQGFKSFYAFDILVNITGFLPSSASVKVASQNFPLTILNVGDNLFRLYGHVGGGYVANNFDLILSSGGSTYCTFLKVDISSVSRTAFQDTAFFAVHDSGFRYMQSPGTSISYSWSGNSDKEYYSSFTGYIYLQNWNKYDYADVAFKLKSSSLNSIAVNLDDRFIPFTMSYLDLGSDTWYAVEALDSTALYHDMPGFVYVVLHLDLTDIERTSASYIQIAFSGIFNSEYSYVNTFTLVDYWGYVDTNTINPLQIYFSNLTSSLKGWFANVGTWISTQTNSLTSALSTNFSNLNSSLDSKFTSLKSWIETQTSSLVTAIKGDASAGDEFNEELEEQTNDLAEVGAVMDSVEKPDIDDVDISVDAYIDPAVLAQSTEGLAALMGNDIFLSVIMMSLVMAIASYVLYGKR